MKNVRSEQIYKHYSLCVYFLLVFWRTNIAKFVSGRMARFILRFGAW